MDHTPPNGWLGFAGMPMRTGAADEVVAGPVEAVVFAKDNRDGMSLKVEVRLDDARPTICGEVAGGPVLESKDYSFKAMPGGSGMWKVPMTMAPGTHRVEVLVTDKSGNVTKLVQQVYALDYNVADPGAGATGGTTVTVEVEGGLDQARPQTIVQMKFSARVKGVTPESVYLEKEEGGGWSRVGNVRMRGIIVAPDIMSGLNLIPGSYLALGCRYRVVVSDGVTDMNEGRVGPMYTEFRVQSHVELGAWIVPDLTKVTTLGSAVFGVRGSRLVMLWYDGSKLTSMREFGCTGGGGDFAGQEINAVKAYDNVPGFEDWGLLLVTTTPKPSPTLESANSVLWGFKFCAASGEVTALFSISLGINFVGYSPTVDYRDGMIAVGRLVSSVQLIPLERAMKAGFDQNAWTAEGTHQDVVMQSFYLSDPLYSWDEGRVNTSYQDVNEAVGLLPGLGSKGNESFLRTMVAYGGSYKAQWIGVRVVGLPVYWLPYSPGSTFKPLPPYTPHPLSDVISKLENAPPANNQVIPTTVGHEPGQAGTDVAIWADASIVLNGVALKTTVAVGVTNQRRQVVVLDANKSLDGTRVWAYYWPNGSPFPDNADYELNLRRMSLDPATGTCAVGVKNKKTSKNTWFILSLLKPDQIEVIDKFTEEDGAGLYGSLSYGVFTSTSARGIKMWEVTNAIRNDYQSAANQNRPEKVGRWKVRFGDGCGEGNDPKVIYVAYDIKYGGDTESQTMLPDFVSRSIENANKVSKYFNKNTTYKPIGIKGLEVQSFGSMRENITYIFKKIKSAIGDVSVVCCLLSENGYNTVVMNQYGTKTAHGFGASGDGEFAGKWIYGAGPHPRALSHEILHSYGLATRWFDDKLILNEIHNIEFERIMDKIGLSE